MQRDGIVKSREWLIPHSQAVQKARQNRGKGARRTARSGPICKRLAKLALPLRGLRAAYSARANDDPAYQVTMIAPFSPESTGTLTRFPRRGLLKQPIVIDNAGRAAGHLAGISLQSETATTFRARRVPEGQAELAADHQGRTSGYRLSGL